MQTLDFLEERMDYLVLGRLQQARASVDAVRRSLAVIQPERVLARQAEEVAFLAEALDRIAKRRLSDLATRLRAVGGLMQSLSPDGVLKRGYSLTTDAEGRLVTSAKQLRVGDVVRTRLAEGEIASRVE
jgi:exodeoxyribonuclease VII large subunit